MGIYGEGDWGIQVVEFPSFVGFDPAGANTQESEVRTGDVGKLLYGWRVADVSCSAGSFFNVLPLFMIVSAPTASLFLPPIGSEQKGLDGVSTALQVTAQGLYYIDSIGGSGAAATGLAERFLIPLPWRFRVYQTTPTLNNFIRLDLILLKQHA